TMPILVGTDGVQKMSKTYGNHIPIETSPADLYGKIMSVVDQVMEDYFAILTRVKKEDYQEKIKSDPRGAKAYLAREIVSEYFGEAAAKQAEKEFNQVFRDQKLPDNIPEFLLPENQEGTWSLSRILVLAGLTPSASEARRLISQKAVEVEGKVITDPWARLSVKDGQVVRVGKRRFVRLRVNQDSLPPK
ncbi:MAG: tyrosine--tRNA ligase, partial [Candidatus Omnitrophica bacterium]|nr:tyrosine--tRNA ligase [Candidatus Omnitrophota bacterium]